MKRKAIHHILPFLFLMACQPGKENTPVQHEQGESPQKKDPQTNCYRYASPTDTIALQIVHVADSINGNLVYKLSGKDKNSGTLQGQMHGDMLVANYTFNSEGMSSVREVAFKLTGGSFIEGYGDIDVQNNVVRFKDINNLKFNDAFKLVEFACP